MSGFLKKLLLSIFILFIANSLFGQTTQWRLIWDANSEDDMAYYQIYRATSQGASAKLDTIHHPGTVFTDKALQKGQMYYYRLKAVNQDGLSSEFSDEVSAAIPKIINMLSQYPLQPGVTISWNLDDYVNDPDHVATTLSWKIDGASQLTYNQQQLDEQRKAEITAPSTWNGNETLVFTVTDPDSFYDVFSCQFEYQAPGVTNEIQNIDISQELEAGIVTISWETTLPSKDYIQYGLNDSYGQNTDIGISFTTNHSDTLSGLESAQTYHFRIVARDNTEKTVFSDDQTFTVKEEVIINPTEIIVYPNPFYAGNEQHKTIHFTNIPQGGSLALFDLMGNAVFHTKNISAGSYEWNLLNNSGKEIGSGLFMYIIQNSAAKEIADGKIVIVR